jgi:uncharacterized protein YgiM (DUF1202 family)
MLLAVSPLVGAEGVIAPGTRCEVTGDGVNLRADSRITAARLGKAYRGDLVTVRRYNMGWYQITPPPGFEVWMHGRYVDRQTGRVLGDHVRLRAGPGTDQHILGKVHRTDTVSVMGEMGDWVRVQASDKVKVWIHGRFVQPATERPAAPARPQQEAPPPPPSTPLDAQATESPATLELLRRAEVLYEAAGSGGSRFGEYGAAQQLYEQVRQQARTPRVRHLAELRLGEISVHDEYQDNLAEVSRDASGRVADLQQENARLRAEYDQRIRELEAEVQRQSALLAQQDRPPRPEDFTAVGWSLPMGKIFRRPGTHRLVVGGRTIYYLNSPDVDLNDDRYWKEYVGVVGTVRIVEGWRAPVLDVESVTVLERP